MKKKKILNIFFKSVSIIFHPMLSATMAVVLLLNTDHYLSLITNDIKISIYIIYLIISFVLPMSFLPLMYYLGLISKVELDSKNDRILPLIVVSIIYALSWYYMKKIGFPLILLSIILSATVSIVCSLVITIFYKISLHTVSIGGLIGFAVFLNNYLNINVSFPIIIIFIVGGLVGTARLYLNKHDIKQVALGYLIGFICVYTSMLMY